MHQRLIILAISGLIAMTAPAMACAAVPAEKKIQIPATAITPPMR